MAVAGFGLTLAVFYPGLMTIDARFIYQDTIEGFRGDWQSPVMTALWALVDPIAPGTGSMFLLSVATYWLAFGLLAFRQAHASVWLAAILLVLAATPPAFVMLGVIWRDILFANTWLLAAALAFAISDRGASMRRLAQAAALGLLGLGVMLRPNALTAAPILFAYIVWPAGFSWKRAAIMYVPVAVGLFALVQIVYYGALNATRQHPLQSIMVFDLGGISHLTGQNQFPTTWTAAEDTLVTAGCYRPTQWDIYWVHEPCRFVMKRLGEEKLFGTPAVTDAWRRAVMSHPGAYLRHRMAFMWNFLSAANFTMQTQDIEDPSKMAIEDRPAFNALSLVHDALKLTPLFRAGPWLLVCMALCAFAWRRRDSAPGAFAIGVCGSAAIYMLTFLAVGVASDFRYAYWAVLASIAGGIVILPLTPESREPAVPSGIAAIRHP